MAETFAAPQAAPRKAYAALALALLAAASMTYYHLGLFVPRVLEIRSAKGLGNGYAFGDDFYPIWLTVHSAHRDLYGAATTREIQSGLFGRPLDPRHPLDPPPDYRTFAYPAFTDLLFWPVAAFDFPALRLVLALLLPLLTIASLGLWMHALDWRVSPEWFVVIALLGLCNYPLLEAFFAEQPGLLVAFLLSAACLALRRNQQSLAGILLALSLIKPQMTALAIFYLLLWSVTDWHRRAKFAVCFVLTTFLLLGSSLLIWHDWIGAWLRVILGYHRYATPALVAELLGPTLGARIGLVAIAAIVIAGLIVAWHNRGASTDSSQFWTTLTLMLAITSVTLLPGQAVYDHVILLPGIFLLIQRWTNLRTLGRLPRVLQNLGAIVLSWPWVAAFALIVARPWISPERFYSTAVFALPIRTAGAFPFALLALLADAAFRLGVRET
jgi:hypothetical protein